MKRFWYSVLFTCLVALLFTSNSYADSPTFTYVELEYIANGDFSISDGGLSADVGLDGFALNVSLELGIFLLQASRFELDGDEIFNSNLEDNISTIAAGLTLEFPRSSVYGLARARRDEFSLTGGIFNEDDNVTSLGFEAGVRVNLTDRFELNANIGRPALDEGSSFGVGAQFYITNNIGITLDFSSIEVEDGDLSAEVDTTSIGLRYNF